MMIYCDGFERGTHQIILSGSNGADDCVRTGCSNGCAGNESVFFHGKSSQQFDLSGRFFGG
jgi:hypothetical protein